MAVGTSPRWVLIGFLVAAAYFVLLGGTPAGEVLPLFRLVNGGLGAILVIWYLWRLPYRSRPSETMLVAALCLGVATALWSAHPRESLDVALSWVSYLAAFALARRLLREPRAVALLMVTMGAIGSVVAITFALLWSGRWLRWTELTGSLPPLRLDLPSGPFEHQHSVVLLAWLLVPALLFLRGRWRWAIRGPVLLALVLITLGGGSRTLWIAITGASLITFLISRRAAVKLDRSHLAIIGAASLVAVFVLVASGVIGNMVDRLTNTESLSGRLGLWTSSLQNWANHPLTGLGPGTFPWSLQEIGYFSTRSWTPRHPDNAEVQLLVELGALGVVAVGLVLGALVLETRRRRLIPAAVWALLFWVGTTVGMNPSDYPYLILPAILWAAVLVSYDDGHPGMDLTPPKLRWVLLSLATPLGAVVLLMSIGSYQYEAARGDLAREDYPAAAAHLQIASSLDPSLALYEREVGVAQLLMGELPQARAHLVRAADLNPSDSATQRALALASLGEGDFAGARQHADRAVELKGSLIANQFARVTVAMASGDVGAWSDDLARIVQAFPLTAISPDFDRFIPTGTSRLEIVQLALDRWLTGEESLAKVRAQPTYLVGFAGRADLAEEAGAVAEDPQSAIAMGYAFACRPDSAAEWLDRATSNDPDWRSRYLVETILGRPASTALELATLHTALLAFALEVDADVSADMLSAGAQDVIGYGQPPAYHPSGPTYPSAVGALLTLVRSPSSALHSLGERCTR